MAIVVSETRLHAEREREVLCFLTGRGDAK